MEQISVKITTILLAEDSFADQKLFEFGMESLPDTHLAIVSDGNEALLYLRREGKYTEAPQPDLVVLDLNLPKLSGSEILLKIKNTPGLKCLPVVIFSGAKPTERMLSTCEQANLYIVKPLGTDQYFAIVKSLVKYARDISKFPDLVTEHSLELQSFLEKTENCDVSILHLVKSPNELSR